MSGTSYSCLWDIPLFSTLSRDSFKYICSAAGKKQIKAGDTLFKQGDTSDAVFVLKEGSFKLVHITESGDEAIVQIVNSGEIIGEDALFSEDSFHSLTAVAAIDSKVCGIDRASFRMLVMSEPELAWQLIRQLGSRLYSTIEQNVESNYKTTKEKILNLLSKLSEEHGEPCREGTLIKLNLTQQEIASIVGVSRVMASNAINQLISDQRLIRDKKYYVLRNRCI